MSIYQDLENIENSLDSDVGTIQRFGYTEAALAADAGIEGHNTYSDANMNNVPTDEGTYLTTQEREKGFRDRLSTLSRAFFTHFFGRVSYNFNKLKTLFSNVIATYKKDYARNFREYDKNITYVAGDVCYIVVGNIRYSFVSLVDSNTDEIVYNGNGTFDYDNSCWRILIERRVLTHPVGEPFMWFGSEIPSGYINFSNGQSYSWDDPMYDFSALKDSESFRSLIAWWGPFGASYNSKTGFTVPNINERYHVSKPVTTTAGLVSALVPVHTHPVTSASISSMSLFASGHTHKLNYAENSHTHYAGWLNEGYNTYPPYNYMGFLPESSVIDFQSGKKYLDQDWDRQKYTVAVETTSTTNSVTMDKHTATNVPSKTLNHTHTLSSSDSAWSVPEGKYRPGTVQGCLILRYV